MMIIPTAIGFAALSSLIAAAPFSLPNGFPNLGDAALHQVYEVMPFLLSVERSDITFRLPVVLSPTRLYPPIFLRML